MTEKITYELSAEDLKKAIREEHSRIVTEGFLNKFDAVMIGMRSACEILGVTDKTLRKYISAGLIRCDVRSENQVYKFSLAYILSLNMDEIKRKYRYNLK